MKCKVCGVESGKYPLCRVCNTKKEKGEIIKCSMCGNWHHVSFLCVDNNSSSESCNDDFLYDAKRILVSKSEQAYYHAIVSSLPSGHHAFPQVNLASFITKNDNSPFHNELFRNVDFLITDSQYAPLFIIEINDQTHLTKERKERDEKVQMICEEAGIPMVKFWTSYGVNSEYIQKKISETISSIPVERIHHFTQNQSKNQSEQIRYQPIHNQNHTRSKKPAGCLGIVASFLVVIACVIAFLI